MKTRVMAVALLCVAGLSGAAQAEVVAWDAGWNFQGGLTDYNWTFDWNAPQWNASELYGSLESSSSWCDLTLSAPASLTIVKQVTNYSTFEWTDYHIVISGDGVTLVESSVTSDRFQTIVISGNTMDFYTPQSVPIGDTVTLQFDLLIPTGDFSFDILQTPTPEPASALLLLVGGLLLRRR